MSTLLIATGVQNNQADTAATPNTIPLRDNQGGITHAKVTCTGIVVNGVEYVQVSSISTTTTASGNSVYLCDCTSLGFTLTLPSATGNSGMRITIKKINSANTLTVATGGGNIDGASTKTLTTQYTFFTVVADGTNWNVTG